MHPTFATPAAALLTAAEPCPYAWVSGGLLYRCAGVSGAAHVHRANRHDGHGQITAPSQPTAVTSPDPAA